MSWQALIIGNTLFVALSTLSIRAIARRSNIARASFVVNSALSAVQYPVSLMFLPFLPTVNLQVGLHYLPWLLGGGVAFAVSTACTYVVLTYLDVGISGVLGAQGVLFTVLFAGAILHEELNSSQIVGSMLLLSAICYILMVAKKPGKHRHRNPRAWLIGLSYSTLGGIAYGLALVNEKFLLGKMNSGTYVACGLGFQLIAILGLALIFQRRQFKLLFKPRVLSLAATAGATRGISGICFILAQVKSNNVALMTVIANFRIIVLILLGAWILKERDKLFEKLTAGFLALAGLSIIFWK